MKTIVISNNKGGVSKTTTATNLACYMAELGEKVLLVDVDGQGNASRSYQATPDKYEVGIYHLLMDQIGIMLKNKPMYKIKDGIFKTSYGVDIMPCDSRIEEVPTWLQDNGSSFKNGAEIEHYWKKYFPYFLSNILNEVKENYTRCIIDTPPNFGYITQSTLIASDYVIVPVELGDFELTGLENLVQKIITLRKEYHINLSILGIVVNRYEGGKNGAKATLDKSLEKQLREHPDFSDYVFKTVIYRNTSVREAIAVGSLAVHYKKKNSRLFRNNFGDLCEEVELWLAKQEAAATREI